MGSSLEPSGLLSFSFFVFCFFFHFYLLILLKSPLPTSPPTLTSQTCGLPLFLYICTLASKWSLYLPRGAREKLGGTHLRMKMTLAKNRDVMSLHLGAPRGVREQFVTGDQLTSSLRSKRSGWNYIPPLPEVLGCKGTGRNKQNFAAENCALLNRF